MRWKANLLEIDRPSESAPRGCNGRRVIIDKCVAYKMTILSIRKPLRLFHYSTEIGEIDKSYIANGKLYMEGLSPTDVLSYGLNQVSYEILGVVPQNYHLSILKVKDFYEFLGIALVDSSAHRSSIEEIKA